MAQWYINLQAPFTVERNRLDTLDHELDVIVAHDGRRWWIKDADMVEVSARLGRFDAGQADRIREQADEIVAMPGAGDHWWRQWRTWRPEPTWIGPAVLPVGWDR